MKSIVLLSTLILSFFAIAQTPDTGRRLLDGVSYTQDDAGLRAALTSLGTAGGEIDIPGSLVLSSQTNITTSIRIKCLGGPGYNVLNYTPSTGTALNVSSSGASFIIEGCLVKTTSASSSTGMQLNFCQECVIKDTHVNGFTGGIRLTGDGVSNHSAGVRLDNVLIDGFCGTGSYGLSIDHTRDMTLDHSRIYTTMDCTTALDVILDQGAEGLWLGHFTMEQGLHAMVVQAKNLGGSYDPAPAALWCDDCSFDSTPGGDALLFDTSLGTANVKFRCSQCWARRAGIKVDGTVATSTASGVKQLGGQNIYWLGGTIEANAFYGFWMQASTGADYELAGARVASNNQACSSCANSAPGIAFNPGLTNIRVEGNYSGNDPDEPGGSQYYGLYCGAGQCITIGNDFSSNISGAITGGGSETGVVYAGALSTSGSSSDNVTITGVRASSHCTLSPTNASAAANLSASYISAKTTNQVTVNHSAIGGMTYDISCSSN